MLVFFLYCFVAAPIVRRQTFGSLDALPPSLFAGGAHWLGANRERPQAYCSVWFVLFCFALCCLGLAWFGSVWLGLFVCCEFVCLSRVLARSVLRLLFGSPRCKWCILSLVVLSQEASHFALVVFWFHLRGQTWPCAQPFWPWRAKMARSVKKPSSADAGTGEGDDGRDWSVLAPVLAEHWEKSVTGARLHPHARTQPTRGALWATCQNVSGFGPTKTFRVSLVSSCPRLHPRTCSTTRPRSTSRPTRRS